MKNIFTGIFLLVSACFMQAQTPNYYRNPDKIYLDSKEGHNGSFTWHRKRLCAPSARLRVAELQDAVELPRRALQQRVQLRFGL